MTGPLDRQDVIAVLDQQRVGRYLPPNPLSYRETLADALMALAQTPADQSLQDALIRHWDETCNGVDWLAGTPEEYASEAIRFLAAEPAPVVTDEAVEAAALAMFADEHCDKRQMQDVLGNWNSRLNDEDQALYRSMARAALEAAAPLLGPRPLLDRATVSRRLTEIVDRSMYTGALRRAEMVDAVMELARPMPTREQLARWMYISRNRQDDNGDGDWEGTFPIVRERSMERADTVLALLNGAES